MTTWALRDVRDVVVNAAADYRTARATVGDTTIRVHTRPGQPAAAILDAAEAAVRRLEDRLGPYPWHGLRIVAVRGRLRDGGPGHRLDPGRRRGRRTCATSSPTRSRTSGSTGWSATTRPASRSRTRRWPTWSRGSCWGCGAGRGAPRAALDRSIYDYGSACYYEQVYIQGGNLLDDARRRIGQRGVLRGAAGLPRATALGAVAHPDAARRDRRRHAARPRGPVADAVPVAVLMRRGGPPDAAPASRPRPTAPPAPRSTRPYVRTTAISFELEPPTGDEMAARIARTIERTPWVVVEVDGVVRAYAYGTRHRDRAAYDRTVETTVYVDAAFAGRGLGRRAMAAVLAVLRLQGAHLAVAGITPPNPASEGLHEALGFRRVGAFEAIGCKFGAWHGVTWFALELGPRLGGAGAVRAAAGARRVAALAAALAGG